MKIAIIGAGNVGTALGSGWLKANHTVTFGVRDPYSAKVQKALYQIPNAQIATITEASEHANVIVIATPPDAILELIPQLGDVTGKVIIDTTNSIRAKPAPYSTAYHAIKAVTGNDLVVKCFNSTGFENMAQPVYSAGGIDMFAAGSNTQAKQVAAALSTDIGFEQCYDFGDDSKVELLEHLALCWINLAIMQGHGRDLAFKLVKR